MKTLKIIALTIIIMIYEFLLIDYAANNFTMSRNWFTIVDSMPVSESNIEFVIFLGQIPLLAFWVWLAYKKRHREEKDLLSKYGNESDGDNT